MTAEKTASAVFFDVMENAPQGVHSLSLNTGARVY